VPASRAASVPGEVIDRLSVYLAGRDEAESVQELAKLAGAARPDGALMLAAVDGKLLAAGSISDGQVVNVPSPSGTAAAAVLRYRLAGLRRRRS
jgi:ubiquinone biosynthesis protein UbiJ